MSRAIALFVLLFASAASAQIIYEPIAPPPDDPYAYLGPDAYARLAVLNCPTFAKEHNGRVILSSPCVPIGEVAPPAPNYFRKRDLLDAATRLPDGSLLVPALVPPSDTPRTPAKAAQPSTQPSRILIIPKKPAQRLPGNKLALAKP